MATGNLLLGQASGAVGSLVFARANGRQVTKARQEAVRYSNTLAQAIQRICISTAGQAYRHMQEVCSRSFQGVQAGKATHDEFMKRNVRLLRQNIRQADTQGLTYSDLRYFTPVGNDTLLPNAYIVSSGSLPSIIFGISPNDPTHARMAGSGVSYRQLIAFYGMKRGDILYFMFMQPDSSGIVRARSARVVLDPWSPISGKASLDVPFIAADNKINCPNPDNSGEFTYLVNDSGDIVYSLVNSDVPLIAAGVFASRRTAAGSWLHSNCQLALYSDSDILDKFTLQKAIDVANGAAITAINPNYLNNAGSEKLPGYYHPDPFDGYELLSYIYNDSLDSYIETNIACDEIDLIKVQFKAPWAKYAAILGAYRGEEYDASRILFTGTTDHSVYVSLNSLASRSLVVGNISYSDWNELNIYIVGDRIVANSNGQSYHGPIHKGTANNAKILLFRATRTQRSTTGICFAHITFSKNGIDIEDLYPVIKKSTNEVGMLDIITNTFYTSETEFPFMPGPKA